MVPFGGGTSVVGGLDPIRGDFNAVVSLDLRRLDQLLELDEVSGQAVLGAGLTGPEAERLLGAQGFSLGHFPQSFQYATMGGFAATRSSGQDSAGYGRFDDMVRGLRMITPAGTLDLGRGPESAAGPDLRQLLIGSEGTFGVITRVRLRVHPTPEAVRYEAWSFPDFATGAAALRAVTQNATGPTVIRLSDEAETGVNLATTEAIGENQITGGCLGITVFEGTKEHVESRHAETRELLSAKGSTSLGEEPAQAWERGRFGAPYLRDSLLAAGAAVRDAGDRHRLVQHRGAQGRRHRGVDDSVGRNRHAGAGDVPHFARVPHRRIVVLHRRRRAAGQSDRAVAGRQEDRVGCDHRHRRHHHPSPRGRRRSPALDARRGGRPRGAGVAGGQGHPGSRGNPQSRQADSVRREIGKVTALTNPLSGHGTAVQAAQAAIARLHARGVEVNEIIGDNAEDARHLAKAAVERGTDALVATGGDGVISNALQVLAGTDIPLGIIPAGTGNDHAREFGIPTRDPEAAADIVVDGWTQTIDLGRIRDANGRDKWFGTVAAAGFDSLVTDRANRMSWPHGRLRYYLAMLRTHATADAAVPLGARRQQGDRRRLHHGGRR